MLDHQREQFAMVSSSACVLRGTTINQLALPEFRANAPVERQTWADCTVRKVAGASAPSGGEERRQEPWLTHQARQIIKRAPDLGRILHSMVLEGLPACPTKVCAVLLEALLNGVVAVGHLLSAEPRRIARAGAPLLSSTVSALR
jgi:hypothetical protein